ncbi:MAG: arginine deiminase family protein [Gemmatimonadota bacterium]
MTSTIALTRGVSPSIVHCELTHLRREPIDFQAAVEQHRQYEMALEAMGCIVTRLPASDDLPDSVFIEDTAVVLDEIAVITRPGAASRRAETAAVARALERYRPIVMIEEPGTIDGGDVLQIGRTLFVGMSTRTNSAGVDQLERIAQGVGRTVRRTEVRQCLHLKTAVTELAPDTVLLNPEWIDPNEFEGLDQVMVDPAEGYGANVVRIGSSVLYSSSFPRTRDRLLARGMNVVQLVARELAKAEGALTCCSLLFPA